MERTPWPKVGRKDQEGNTGVCPYYQFKYKYYTSMANAATAIGAHCAECVESKSKVKDAGPMMPDFTMEIFDSINIIEAKMTETGGLDFEANFEFVFMCLMSEVLKHSLQAFRDLVNEHKLSKKAAPDGKGGKAFGINVCLWRLLQMDKCSTNDSSIHGISWRAFMKNQHSVMIC